VNIFVTGGAGYIGSVCVEELLDAGHEVTVYDNLTEGHRSAVDNRAVFIHARLSDTENIREAIRDSKAEAVIHFAANALVGESMVNPSKYFRNKGVKGVRPYFRHNGKRPPSLDIAALSCRSVSGAFPRSKRTRLLNESASIPLMIAVSIGG
jgi:NAD(P)-dependent dehydrogenase (short-subunit alcohol dehydrogenase family)